MCALAFHFYESFQAVQALLQDFPVNDNPLERRIDPLLSEQKSSLWHALLLLQQDSLDREQFKYVISVIYRSNEAFDPVYRAWIRASGWMESTPIVVLGIHRNLSNRLREHLISAVPYIYQMYGKNETRYIVPPLYRYEMKIMN